MGFELLYLANKDTGHPVKCEFQVNISWDLFILKID